MVSHISSSRNIFFALKITNMKTLIFYFAAVRCPHQPTAYSRYIPDFFLDKNTGHYELCLNLKSQRQTLSFERLHQKTFFWKLLISSLEGSKINFLSRTKLSFTMSIGESFTELKCLAYFFGPVNSCRQKNINIGLASGQQKQKSFIAILIKQCTFKWWIRIFFWNRRQYFRVFLKNHSLEKLLFDRP